MLAFPSVVAFKQTILQYIRKMTGNKAQVLIEDDFIVCYADDPVSLALKLENTFGIQKIALARKVAAEFAKVTEAIADAGSKMVLPGEKFFITVEIGNSGKNHNFRSRDIEFAATGTLTAKFAGISSRPAKNEREANRIITTFIGRKFAYVCLQISKGPGGLPIDLFGSMLCGLYNSLSFLSCLTTAKIGFLPEIILLYSNETELIENAKLVQVLAEKAGLKKQVLKVAPIRIKDIDSNTPLFLLLKDAISFKILINQPNYRIAVPLSPATHPLWFIESIMLEASSRGKIAYLPLMFAEEKYINQEALQRNQKFTILTKSKLQQYDKLIDDCAKWALRNMKELRMNIGPNYLHQILDSI